jgi:hypothetical protein
VVVVYHKTKRACFQLLIAMAITHHYPYVPLATVIPAGQYSIEHAMHWEMVIHHIKSIGAPSKSEK